jgi:integrase/recombinase XerD
VTSLAPALQEYFTSYLAGQRAASPATISTYRDTWQLLLVFLTAQTGKPAYDLDLSDIDEHRVTAFLDHLERDRHNSIATRNLRLSGIKSVMAFQAPRSPERLDAIARIHAIPVKKSEQPEVTHLDTDQLQALLDAIPTDTWTGRRDKTMFALTAQTGLRVSELISLNVTSLHLTPTAAYLSCTGKGRKQRTTPLTRGTVTALGSYLTERARRPGDALFPNPHGGRLSPDAVRQRLQTHVSEATSARPELARKRITTHTLRHTAAMTFLAAGIDTAVIALWLGHESIATTNTYLHADMTTKQRALDRTRQPNTPSGAYKPDDQLLAWLKAL